MSAAYRVNFDLANNEDMRQAFSLGDTAGAPLDLAGASLRMHIETLAGETVVEATTANGRIILIDAPAGRFDLAIPAATMRTLTAGAYRHDLLLVAANGNVRRIWSGSLTLDRGVTE